MLQDVERFLEVGITVRVIGPEPVAGKVPLGGFVHAGSQLVGLCVSGESVGTPAGGAMPHSAAAGGIDVDADHERVVGFVAVTNRYPADPAAALFEGDVFLFGHDERCGVTTALEMLDEDALEHRPVCWAR